MNQVVLLAVAIPFAGLFAGCHWLFKRFNVSSRIRVWAFGAMAFVLASAVGVISPPEPMAANGSAQYVAQRAPVGFTQGAALTLCESAIRLISKDPEKAEIPYVDDLGDATAYYFAWGHATKMLRLRNGLGLEVAATGSCVVNKSAQRIVSLTLNGKEMI